MPEKCSFVIKEKKIKIKSSFFFSVFSITFSKLSKRRKKIVIYKMSEIENNYKPPVDAIKFAYSNCVPSFTDKLLLIKFVYHLHNIQFIKFSQSQSHRKRESEKEEMIIIIIVQSTTTIQN